MCALSLRTLIIGLIYKDFKHEILLPQILTTVQCEKSFLALILELCEKTGIILTMAFKYASQIS